MSENYLKKTIQVGIPNIRIMYHFSNIIGNKERVFITDTATKNVGVLSEVRKKTLVAMLQ